MDKKRPCYSLLCTALFLASARVAAADHVVCEDLDDDACTDDTINAAISHAVSGDTILIRGGTYTEDVTITSKNLTLKRETDGDEVVLIGGIALVNVASFTLDGIDIARGRTGTNPTGSINSAIYIQGGGTITVKNAVLSTELTSGSPRGLHVSAAQSASTTVNVDNTVFEGWLTGIYLNPGATLTVTGSSFIENTSAIGTERPASLSVTSSQFIDNSSEAIGLTPHNTTRVAVDSFTFSGNTLTGTTFSNLPFPAGITFNGGGLLYAVPNTNGGHIRNAITNSDAGDVILLDGSFSLTSTLDFNKAGIAIYGASRTNTIVQGPGNDYGILWTANNVRLSNLTFKGAGTYGLKIQPPPAGSSAPVTGVRIDNVTVSGSGKAEIDLHYARDVVISNTFADGSNSTGGSTPGAGIALTDATDVTLTDVKTRNNGWGAIAVYTYPGGNNTFTGAPGFSSDVTITGLDYNEDITLYGEGNSVAPRKSPTADTEAGRIPDLVAPQFTHIVTNTGYRANGANFTHYRPSESDALSFAAGLHAAPGFANTASVVRELTSGEALVSGSLSVQAAINALPAGGTVNIGPGTYTELTTSNLGLKLDKAVTLQGVTSGGDAIEDVDDIEATIVSGGESSWGTNFHVTAADVTIRGLRFEAKKTQNSDSECSSQNVNKAFEITSNNFTLEHSEVAAASGFNYDCATSTALYFGDEAPDDLNKFTVHGNELHGGVTITNGAGDGGGTVDFTITDNVFSGHHFLRVRGAVTNVGWLNHSAHVPTTVTGNDMSGVTNYLVQVWGNDAQTQVTSSFVADLASNNELGTHVYVTSATAPRFANYSEYGGTAPAFFVRKSLSDALATAANDDTIHLDGNFTLATRLTLDKPGLTLAGAGASTILKPTSSALAVAANGVTISNLSIVQPAPRTGTGIEATASIEDLTISGVTVNGADVGFRVGSGAGVNGLEVSNSHFDDNTYGWYLAYDTEAAIADGSRVRNVAVTGTSFNGNYTKGLYAEKLEAASFDDIEVIESGTSHLPWPPGNGIDINLKRGTYATISITNSLFQDSGEYEPDLVQVDTPRNNLDGALVIKARDDGSYTALPASLSGVTVTGNTFISSDSTLARVALRIGEGDRSNAGPTNVTISGNSFTGFAIPLHNASANPLTAEHNWWGSASGPGTSLVGTVDFTPWFSNAGMTTLGGVADPDPGPGPGTGTGTGTGNQQPVPPEELNAINDIIDGVVIPDDGESITDATVDALSNAAAVSSTLVTEVITNIAQVDTSSAIDALSVISKVANVTSNAAQGAAAGTNTSTTQAVTQAGTQALNSFAALLGAIDTKVNTGTTTGGVSTPPVVLTAVQKDVVQQNTIQTVASAVKLVTATASEATKQAVLQDVGKIITANLNLGVPLTTTQTTALISVAQGATDTNASVESQLDSGVQIKPENKELISKAELSIALEGSGITEAELDQFLAELSDAINPANVVLGDRNGEDALKDGLGGAETITDGKTGVTLITLPGDGNAQQPLALEGRRLFAVTTPKTIPVRVVSSSIVASTVPDGIRVRANGAVTITSANIANTVVPASYDPIGLYADLKRYGTISIDDAGRISVTSANFRFSATFDFNGVVKGIGSPGDVTRVHGPASGASEADTAYQFSLTYRDGTQQALQPFIHDDAFVASLRSRGLEPKMDSNTGLIDVSGTLFRPSYFVDARGPADVQFWSERKDANGLAYRAADLNGDGTIDVEVISSTGIQAAYRLP